jgi:molybdopterin molybdotransferase
VRFPVARPDRLQVKKMKPGGLLSFEQAQAMVLTDVAPLEAEKVDLAQSVGRVLAEPLVAPHDLPPFDNVAMDGYVLRAEDTQGASPTAPVRLRVVGESAAGKPYSPVLRTGEAIAISTGAPIPNGADAALPIEDAQIEGKMLVCSQPVRQGAHIRPKGQDVQAGSLLISAGIRLRLQHLGVLAALGLTPVPVHRRPRVAIVVSGSELLPYDAPLQPGKIRDTNSLLLYQWLKQRGFPAVFLGVVPDDLDSTLRFLERALAEAEVVVLTGGVSVGEHDLIKPALEQIGARILFWRVNIKPGKPILFARWQGHAIFGLPGNPLAVVVGLMNFVLPHLASLEGEAMPLPRSMTACLATPVHKKEARAEFLTARLSTDERGFLLAEPTPMQGSALLGSLALADAFLYLPSGVGDYPAGTRVKALPIP